MKYLFVFFLGLISCGDEVTLDKTDNEQNDKKWSLDDKESLKISCLKGLSLAEELNQVEYSKESKDEFCSCSYGIVVSQYDSIEQYHKVSENKTIKTLFKEGAENPCVHTLAIKKENNQGLNYDFKIYNLTDKLEINASIELPITGSDPEFIHNEGDFKSQISIGQSFNLFIEDYGSYPNGINDEREVLSKGKNRDYYTEVIEDSLDVIVIKKTAKINTDQIFYSIYGQRKIDGIYYEIKGGDRNYSKEIIALLRKSIHSFE